MIGAVRKTHGLFASDSDEAAENQRVGEELEHPVLRFLAQVNEDVAAEDEVGLHEGRVGHEVMLGENHVLAQGWVEAHEAVLGGVVGRRRLGPARRRVVLVEGLDDAGVVNSLARRLQRFRVHVGGVDRRSSQKAFLAQQDREAENLFPGAAARDPDLRARVGLQDRQHLGAERAENLGIAEKLRRADGEPREDFAEVIGLVEATTEHVEQALLARTVHETHHPSLHRAFRIISEIVPVAQENSFQEKMSFDGIDRRHRKTSPRDSHTLSTVIRLSRFTGFGR